MENKKVLLSVKDLHVKFRVRGRILTAIRGISLETLFKISDVLGIQPGKLLDTD